MLPFSATDKRYEVHYVFYRRTLRNYVFLDVFEFFVLQGSVRH